MLKFEGFPESWSALHWPWDSLPYPSLDIAVEEMGESFMGKLATFRERSLTMGMGDLVPVALVEESWLCPITEGFSYHLIPHPCLPNIYPIYDLLYCVTKLILQHDSLRISMIELGQQQDIKGGVSM